MADTFSFPNYESGVTPSELTGVSKTNLTKSLKK